MHENHACLPFMVKYAAATINLGRCGPDGRTAFELRRGHGWRGKLADFREKVMWVPLGIRKSSSESTLQEGIFLGPTAAGCAECWIGLAGKVTRGRGIKRLTDAQRCGAVLFGAMAGSPWCLDTEVERQRAAEAFIPRP